MFARITTALFAVLLIASPAFGQVTPGAPTAGLGPYDQVPQPYEILGISVEGVENENTRSFVQQTSGLRVGQSVTLPGDQVFADAIRNVYRLGLFSNVRIVEERRAGTGVFLAIQVTEEPRLADYTFAGVKKGHRDDLQKSVPLIKGTPVRPAEIERSIQVVRDFYREKGFLLTDVKVEREQTAENAVRLEFVVDRGQKVEVGEIGIEGNQEVSDRRLRRKMSTKEDRWWRFWKSATFKQDKYQEDLHGLVDYYNQRGYFDARILDDTVFVRNEAGSEPEVVIGITVEEGPRYHIRNIDWEGNTVYTDEFLTQSLGFEPGDAYNSQQLESNLYANRNSSDVSSLYLNRGYMRFNVQPTISVVEGDSLDLHFEVVEGDVYDFGDIKIAGNTKTKEHVIRRELYTIPGQTFSREYIQESIRRLSQLNYFTQESLQQPPGIQINEQAKTVDLTYTLEEASSDQLELSGTWGSFGLVLMLRFNFNNFSAQNLFNGQAWRPLPSGDGQQLSVGIQTNGTYYQSYSLSFTEPWFRGKPTPVGFGLSYSRYGAGGYLSRYGGTDSLGNALQTASARVFYDQRLKWPDDKFNSSTSLRYQFYENGGIFTTIPRGITQFLTLQQAFSRNSQDHPFFPQTGSMALLSVELAPPLPGFAQHHKWRLRTNWNAPLLPKLTLSVGTDYGFVGSLTGERVAFERFIVGGSPFDTQGAYNQFGRDIIYMRGYPVNAIGPRRNNEAVGGTILNKYTSELRWMAIQSQQLQAAPYLFADAANTWNSFGSYNPTQLYRSAGVGMRLFLPIIGMLELAYGYNFDTYVPLQRSSGGTGERGWSFQFSLGQGFNQ